MTGKVVIETERLLLREWEESDAIGFYEMNADAEVLKYTGDTPFDSIEDASKFIRDYAEYERHGYGRWAVVLKSDARFIGFCGLKMNEESQVDLGFRFIRKYWRQGYATEAAQACLDFGLNELGIKEIVGRAMPENVASIRVLQKIGMNYWKTGTCEGMSGARYYRGSKYQTA